ncbi:MAG TPA: TetR/AcrR family transcriptional regulator [Protaetiibacter sp.]|jgi:AcrR family transcriptional regulator|nr:TetR/AcrR family transcriptional regulator [Protaetiibacter sp.]
MTGGRPALVRAMIDIISERGFEGLSVRGVAARAGVSVGAVQHHFPTKDAMLDAAMAAIAAAAGGRSSELERVADPVEQLHALVDLLIPASATSPVTRVWLAFAARAAVDESTRTNYVRLWARVRDELQLLLAAAGGSPELAAESSRELLALLDGLALGIAAEQQHPDVARRIAHRRVDELIRTPN